MQNQEWREYWKKYAKIVQEYLPTDTPEEEKCWKCEGKGYILTLSNKKSPTS